MRRKQIDKGYMRAQQGISEQRNWFSAFRLPAGTNKPQTNQCRDEQKKNSKRKIWFLFE